jgi:hypothetical protein
MSDIATPRLMCQNYLITLGICGNFGSGSAYTIWNSYHMGDSQVLTMMNIESLDTN